MKRPPIATLVGLFVALGLPFVLTLLFDEGPGRLSDPSFVAREWLITLILLGIVFFWERQSLASLGIKKVTWRGVLWGIVGFIVGALSFILTSPLVTALGLSTTLPGITELAQTPIALRIAIVITAGITERSTYTAMMPKGLDYLFEWLAPQTSASQREAFKAQAEEAISSGLVGGEEPLVTLERTTPAGMRVEKYPDTFQQNVPGYTIYGIFWIVNLLAGSVLEEKRAGTFRRLLVAPMSRAVILAGKLVPYYLINVIQLAIMLGASSLLFGMSLGHSPAGLAVVSLAAAASATGLGVLVSALARTEAQAGGLTVLLLLTMSALGGCFVPRFIMPAWLQTIGLITPHAWALDAYQDLMVRGYGLMEVLPEVGALAAFAVLFFGIGVWRFRFE